jgi:hypothetical protein
MLFPRLYTVLVVAREPVAASTGPATDPAVPRAFFVSFHVRATSAAAAVEWLVTTPAWTELTDPEIEEVDAQGILWRSWWRRSPQLLGQTGRAYFEVGEEVE